MEQSKNLNIKGIPAIIQNCIGETVLFTKDLHCNITRSRIENLKVYSFSKQKMDTCEYWAGDNHNECYKIADFNLELSKKEARLFFGEPVQYGFFKNDPYHLRFLPVVTCPIPEGFEVIDSEAFEKIYSVPKSMYDLGMIIDQYLESVMVHQIFIHETFIKKRYDDSKIEQSQFCDEYPY